MRRNISPEVRNDRREQLAAARANLRARGVEVGFLILASALAFGTRSMHTA